ncbi:MAG TPA: aminoglycoside 6-adenylyltransferase, partial [Candidatus Methylomirabilis sp.]|nr:aminoglycoside 6-adenylyltransferase [Candidatus Methylomirabilis sp.]
CRGQRGVHGALVLGSAANDRAVDALSDLDLMVITTSRRRLSSLEWLELSDFPLLFSWTYDSPLGGQNVHQLIYDGPLVVDLAFVSSAQAFLLGTGVQALAHSPLLRRRLPPSLKSQIDAWLAIAGRGTTVLFDRAGLARRIAISPAPMSPKRPTQGDYLNTVYSLFGLLLWESKQIVRGELWMAIGTVDHQVKTCLLTMMEWHAMATNPQLGDTWYGGRRVDEWANPKWATAIRHTWPSYDAAQAWDALFATLELFSDVSAETARLLGYQYPAPDERRVRSWITSRREASSAE